MAQPIMTSERGLDRLVNFSDAVVGIAITLLVLPLIDIAEAVSKATSIGGFLSDNFGALVSFAITFAVVGRMWFIHHQFFTGVIGYTHRIMSLNMLWLAGIVLIPFAAAVLSRGEYGDAVINGLYIGVLLFTTVAMTVVQLVCAKTPGILTPESAAGFRLSGSLAVITAMVLALVLSVLVPWIGVAWLLVLFLGRPLAIVWARILREKPVAAAS